MKRLSLVLKKPALSSDSGQPSPSSNRADMAPSEKRAEALRNALIQRRVPPIKVVGTGQSATDVDSTRTVREIVEFVLKSLTTTESH